MITHTVGRSPNGQRLIISVPKQGNGSQQSNMGCLGDSPDCDYLIISTYKLQNERGHNYEVVQENIEVGMWAQFHEAVLRKMLLSKFMCCMSRIHQGASQG